MEFVKGRDILVNNIKFDKMFKNGKITIDGDRIIIETNSGVWEKILSDSDKAWMESDIPSNITGIFKPVDRYDGHWDEMMIDVDYVDYHYQWDINKSHPEWFWKGYTNFIAIQKDFVPTWKCSVFDTFLLDTGSVFIKHYSKYNSGLGIIVDPYKYPHTNPLTGEIELFRDHVQKSEYNLGEGKLDYMIGEFFVSKKGTKIFKVKEDGKHVLLKDDWGGAFSTYQGGKLPHTEEEGALYYKRASSNGGGLGYDYSVVPVDWKKVILEDEL